MRPPSRLLMVNLATASSFWGVAQACRPEIAAVTFSSRLLSVTGLATMIGYLICRVRYPIGMLVAALAGGWLAGFSYTAAWRVHHRMVPDSSPRPLKLSGWVCAPPDIRAEAIYLTIQPEHPPPELPGSRNGRVLVYAPRYPVLPYGTRVEVTGSLEKPMSIREFNYPLYLERYRVYALVRRPEAVSAASAPPRATPLGYLYQLRHRIERHINRNLPEPEASFLAGILLGSRRGIPEDIQEALRTTGTSHIIAISGANITIMLTLLLKFLPLSRRSAQCAVVTGLSLFMILLTGASASVVRGGLVATLGSYLKMRGRQAWPYSLILFSMLALLLYNPLLLVADPGFQLSFGAFAGLAFLSQPITSLVDRLPGLRGLPTPIRQPLVETAAATGGTFPVSLTVFGQVSLLGLVVNPLILWLLPYVTLNGFWLILSGLFPSGLLSKITVVVALPLWLSLHSILACVRWFGHITGATLQWHCGWGEALGLYALALAALRVFRSLKLLHRPTPYLPLPTAHSGKADSVPGVLAGR
jgi:competence protein ComEC